MLNDEPAPGTAAKASLPQRRCGVLGVRVPVTIALARKRLTVRAIVQIAPGTILRFDKPCAAALELRAGSRTVALGHCVEVGRRLGLAVTCVAAGVERG